MSEVNLPTKVFAGPPTEAMFLTSLLEAAGIQTNLTGGALMPPGDIYVWKRDEEAAREIIDDFLKNGKRMGVAPDPARAIQTWPVAGKT
jgi:hypothetical protein